MSYAAAWHKWFDTIETGAKDLTNTIIDMGGLRGGHEVLDIGTGIGEPAISAALAQGDSGRITAIDRDPQMIEIAKRRASEKRVRSVRFVVDDIEAAELPSGFDVILARWSLMFVADKKKLLRKLASVLKPEGKIVAGLWCEGDRVPALTFAEQVVYEHFGWPQAQRSARQAFALADQRKTAELFSEAGFACITSKPCKVTYEFETAAAYVQYRIDVADPVWETLSEHSEQTRLEAYEAVERALERFVTPTGRYRIPNEAYCLAAK